MKLFCSVGLHRWKGCACSVCRKTRDTEHQWQGCKCVRCGLARDSQHDWKGCKCVHCGSLRNSQHVWKDCKCTVCHRVEHEWGEGYCTRCRATNHDTQSQDMYGGRLYRSTSPQDLYSNISVLTMEWIPQDQWEKRLSRATSWWGTITFNCGPRYPIGSQGSQFRLVWDTGNNHWFSGVITIKTVVRSSDSVCVRFTGTSEISQIPNQR